MSLYKILICSIPPLQVQSHENVWHQRLHTQVYIRGTLGIRRAHSIYANIRRCTAMVTNHLRQPYGVYFTNNRTILRRPYGARPAAGRIVRFMIICLDIVRCPVNFRYYLKFHGVRTAFGRVIKD